MKRILSLALIFILIFSLSACNKDIKKADETAAEFIEALLLRDEKTMRRYAHPDYLEKAVPNDDFYKELSENHFFSEGHELTAISAMAKNYISDTSIDGALLECIYVIRSNELFYDITLMILENDNGYGVISVSAKLNTDPTFYDQSAK